MSAVVLAALLLFRTGIAPQPEPLSAAWWWLRPAGWVACGICLLPFLFGFRWAERPAATSTAAPTGPAGTAIVTLGTIAAGAGLAVVAGRAFPVPDAVLLVPAIGFGLFTIGALALRVDPLAPLREPATGGR